MLARQGEHYVPVVYSLALSFPSGTMATVFLHDSTHSAVLKGAAMGEGNFFAGDEF